MAGIKQHTGEFELPSDPGLQLVLYRLGKIEEAQAEGKNRDANVMSRLDQIVGTLNQTNIALATGTERVNAHTRDIADVKEQVKDLEDEQSGMRKALRTASEPRQANQTGTYRRASIDAKFWVTISTALAALATAIAAVFGSSKDKEPDRGGKTIIEMPGSHVDKK